MRKQLHSPSMLVAIAAVAPATSARIAGLTYRSASLMTDPHMGTVIDVPCPTGLTAIGGGVETPHTLNSFMNDSHPTTGRSWELTMVNSGDVPEQLTAWAVCAKVEGNAPKAAASAERPTVHRVPLPR